ncbi:hypothetical protein H4582DRAFT_2060143 [Lactarius indigo]|nr:hypothetical protein H4582DRAFT_2060143 [Lactarius indigo]
MSQISSSIPSSVNFEEIFRASLEAYREKTKEDISSHPLAIQLQSCDSPGAIVDLLRAQAQALDKSQSAHEKLTNWLDPTVKVLCKFSAILGGAVGLVFPPASAIFTGIGVLFQTVKDVGDGQDSLVDLFARIGYFFKRLETYIEVQPSAGMVDIIVKIMVEVLSILGIVTKEIGQGVLKKCFKKLVGKKDVEDALQRLDNLTQEEVRMARAEALKVSRETDDRTKDVSEKMKGVNEKVRGVGTKAEGIDVKVQGVSDKAQDVRDKTKLVTEGRKETKVELQQASIEVGHLRRS